MTIDPLFGNIQYSVVSGDTGTYIVDIAATNSQATTHKIWTLHVNLNQAPIISDFWPSDLDTAGYHEEIDFGIFAFDPDDHTITYSWTHNGQPVGLNSPEVSIISETFGNNEVRVTASDGVNQTENIWNFFIRGTAVNGSVSGNWIMNNSPYVVFSDVTIDTQDSLIIDPGVHVNFAGNYRLVVNGYIEVNGNYSNMVIFNSNFLDPLPDDWLGVSIEAMSNDNSRISYCDIRHAHTALKINYANPTINNCVFAYNGHYGVKLDHSASEIYNVTSTRNQTGGILCQVSNAIINNCIIAFNQQYGVKSEDSNPVLSYNDVHSNSTNYHGCSMGWGSINANPMFAALDDFHLTMSSPCINVGDPNRPNDPDNTRSDMGALYFSATAVGDQEEILIPEVYALRPAYPNPFNAVTEIEYWLPEHSVISLEIYSVLGRKVGEIASANQAPGIHRIKWDAGDFSSGIYFISLTANSLNGGARFNSVGKAILIK